MVDIPARIRAGIATARERADAMLTPVQHIPVIGRDQSGPLYDTENPITRKAIVEDVGEMVVSDSGDERLTSTKLTFLEPVTIDEFDIFVVNGKELNVAKRSGLLDPQGVPYFSEVWLGRGRFRT